jgi:hypothetical protein
MNFFLLFLVFFDSTPGSNNILDSKKIGITIPDKSLSTIVEGGTGT